MAQSWREMAQSVGQRAATRAGGLDAPQPSKLQRIAMYACEHLDEIEVIYKSGNRLIAREHLRGGQTLVMKMWSRPGVRTLFRRISRTGSCDYEYRNLCLFQDLGVPVPRPLGMCRLPPNPNGYVDALFMEDLGECTSSTEYVKNIVRKSLSDELHTFDEQLIDMTSKIVRGRVVDTDHGLVNILVRPSGDLVRIDVEMARRAFVGRITANCYGRMLGRLLATYTFAVQPEISVVTAFTSRLVRRLGPSSRVLRIAEGYVREEMDYQRRRSGINTPVVFPW